MYTFRVLKIRDTSTLLYSIVDTSKPLRRLTTGTFADRARTVSISHTGSALMMSSNVFLVPCSSRAALTLIWLRFGLLIAFRIQTRSSVSVGELSPQGSPSAEFLTIFFNWFVAEAILKRRASTSVDAFAAYFSSRRFQLFWYSTYPTETPLIWRT